MTKTRRAILALLAAALLLVQYAATALPADASPRARSGIRILGAIHNPLDPSGNANRVDLFGITADGKYLIGKQQVGSNAGFIKYDLSKRIPRSVLENVADVDALYSSSGYLATFDGRRNLMYVLRPAPAAGGTDANAAMGPVLQAGEVDVVDLRTLKRTDRYLMTDLEPGFIADGITYVPKDDRIYLLGQWRSGPPNFLAPGFGVSGVIALDAATHKTVWHRMLGQCRGPLGSVTMGAVLARSDRIPALYFGCSKTQVGATAIAGVSGVGRLWITAPHKSPRTVDDADAQDFKFDFYPVSGNYSNGIAVFDYAADRLLIKSDSPTTPGAWVFDGPSSAFVGQIGVPDRHGAMGYSQRLGHVYMGSSKDLVVADGRATPAPQGRLFDLSVSVGLLVSDPGSKRLFMPTDDLSKFGLGKQGEYGTVVLEDDTPVSLAPPAGDYDSLTSDIPEGPDTAETHAATISGFGARAWNVGSYGPVLAACAAQFYTQPEKCTNPSGFFSPGDRGAFFSRVKEIDLRNSGASASAQSVAPDTLTANDIATFRNILGASPAAQGCSLDDKAAQATHKECDQDKDPAKQSAGYNSGGGVEGAVDYDNTCSDPKDDAERPICATKDAPIDVGGTHRGAVGASAWPWRGLACLDSSGEHVSDSSELAGSKASVSCDIARELASASATANGLNIPTGDSVHVSIGSTSFEASSERDPVLGSVAVAAASARQVEISIEGIGSLHIGRILATARTLAHGRPKTNSVSWSRTFQDVRLRDGAGKLVYSCDLVNDEVEKKTKSPSPARAACRPEAMIEEVNATFESQLHLRLPDPERVWSPQGAFAGLQKTQGEYYDDLSANDLDSWAVPALDALIVADGNEKSRLHMQFAAIQTSSIYGITSLGSGDIGALPLPPVPPVGPILRGNLQPILPPPAPQPAAQPTGPFLARLAQGALLLIRSPGEAALVGLIGLIFASAATAVRRRQLMLAELGK